MIKVALVGVGGISGAHIPAWKRIKEAELAALCDVRAERMEAYPELRHYTDLDEMLEKEKPDILDICLPTYLHVETALKALRRGIHVLLEKPVAQKAEDVSLLYGAAAENGVKLMVAQVLRFWPEYELIRHLVQSGRYGKLLSGYMCRLSQIPGWSWEGWMTDEKRSSLVPFDLHIHDLDFLVSLLGKPTGMVPFRCKRPEQDSLQATYQFGDVFINVESAWYAAAYPFRANYRFQFETAVVENMGGRCMIYQADGQVIDLSAEASGATGDINLPKSNAYYNEIRYFTDCVLEDRPVEKVRPEELEEVLHLLHRFSE